MDKDNETTISFRLRGPEKSHIQKQADVSGKNISQYLRELIFESAEVRNQKRRTAHIN